MPSLKAVLRKAIRELPEGVDPRQTGYNLPNIDYRHYPELYHIGKGEQGVLTVEPYKSELIRHWKFRNPEVARESADQIYALYERYREARDFVGMDMARKFLMMGYTRAIRYANYEGGRKRTSDGSPVPRRPPEEVDTVKRKAALIFKEKFTEVLQDPVYQRLKERHLAREEITPEEAALQETAPVDAW